MSTYYRLCATPGCTSNLAKRDGSTICTPCERRPKPVVKTADLHLAIPDLKGAACVNVEPETFFLSELETAAKKVCARCPVAQRCFQYAWDAKLSGVWGGTTSDERTEMRRAEALQRRRDANRRAL